MRRTFNSKNSPVFTQMIADFSAIWFTNILHYLIRFESGLVQPYIRIELMDIFRSGFVLAIYWMFLFFLSGLYKNWYERPRFDEITTILKVTFVGSLIIGFLVISDSTQSPRMMFILYFTILFFSVSIGRSIARRLQVKFRTKGYISVPALIIGSEEMALNLYKEILKSPAWGYKIVGFVILKDKAQSIENHSQLINGIPVFSGEENLKDIIVHNRPSEVLIAADNHQHLLLLDIVGICSEANIRVKIRPDLFDIFSGQTRAFHIYGIPLIEISPQLMKPWQEFMKRVFDFLFSLSVLLIGMPIWLLIALLIKLESKGPIFYQQERVGKDGKIFRIHKFRSMVTNADKIGEKWTLINDPRVTKFGKFLRKSHLDEIPQFWDVLRGVMSIVGPRPEQPHYVEEFAQNIPYYKRRLKVRPGITGWWQVKYQPHVLTMEEIENRLKDDFYYIENFSLQLDFEIILRTVWCVVTGHGQA
ncbi:MAG: Lipopolysaccharide synthesis sugar transferase [Ignavibacteria bacterium]|nr:Lipopolysaccharide synthesis sugar transferase [Ignavibacteria bacterium]